MKMKNENAHGNGLPTEDEYYNNLEYSPVDGEALDLLVEGMEVLGAEPVDYPLTDGIIIYLKAKDGSIKALDIGTDILNREDNPFYINIATLMV